MPPGTLQESSILYAFDAVEVGDYLLARMGRLQDVIGIMEGRAAEEAIAAREAQQAQEALGFRTARDATAFARMVREVPREIQSPAAHSEGLDEPALELNRPTTLLACICLLRINRPGWPSSLTASILRLSFPEFFIYSTDIEVLFQATCLNRPHWVRHMQLQPNHRAAVRQAHRRHRNEITRPVLELLRLNRFADPSLFPQEHCQDRRAGIDYLQRLVGVSADLIEYVRGDERGSLRERVW